MIGRGREQATLHGLLAEAGARGSALLVSGAAGIGKSTLVEDARARAVKLGFRVLACAGVQRESSPAGLAGLQQLLHAVVDRAGALPERQRAALLSAFGVGPSTAPEQLLLSVAVLGVLEEIAEERPLLVIVEDIQWMDQPTVAMVGFVGHRIRESPIVMLVTCRSDGPDPVTELGLPELPLGRLAEADAAGLLAEASPALNRVLRERVLREAEGNPLALVELSRGLLDRGLLGSSSLPDRLPLSVRLENTFSDQIGALPTPVQDVLLLTACGDADVAGVAAAAGHLGIDDAEDQVRRAEAAGMVRATGGRLAFRHPLVQSAVYGGASFPRRIAAHRALAAVHASDPERSAWHRSAATVGRDEHVARDLETAAGLARKRGNLGAAMRYHERAAELSPDPVLAARRLTLAGDDARQAGLIAATLRLTAAARKITTDPVVLAHIVIIEETLALHANAESPSIEDVTHAARRVAPVDRNLAATLLLFAAVECRLRPDPGASPAVLVELERLTLADDDLRMMMGRAFLDAERHAEQLTAAAEQISADISNIPTFVANGFGSAAESVHDWTVAGHCWSAATVGYRRSGALSDLVSVQARQGRNLLVRGHLPEALTAADEAWRHGVDLGLPVIAAHGAMLTAHVAAWRGDGFTEALTAADQLTGIARGDLAGLRHWTLGLEALTSGRNDDALAELLQAAVHPDFAPVVVADLTEAAVRCGAADRAVPLVAAVDRMIRGFPALLPRLLVHRSRALLAGDTDEAEQHFRAALAPDFPLQSARTRLLFGEWLRRRRRVDAARDELALAAVAFHHAGTQPWAARAEAGLRGAGVTVSQSARSAAPPLTAQELQIARLAATGLSNKEIADQLFLSHHTVGSHLYRAFPKLGITNRAALRDALKDLS
ncbi:helix-turn-helix transcriptional regulator [Actinoplanes solisilvae]|uniref:helix-turn-helix transcriptional regulator n=1 Tax=Actinoplanes solisilvae TaxID=2486853 RepID=UPI000FD70AD7|nr:AAA family ATPase [Actinoplanes solisilvae]